MFLTMGPPADMLYAVDPDGVATIRPSTCAAARTVTALNNDQAVDHAAITV